jgi:OmpA-OmpF porin, OOP family
MRNSIGLFLTLLLVILSGSVNADLRTHGYLHTQEGSVWRDIQSRCVWTTYWEVDVPECELAMAPAMVEQAEPEAVPAETKPAMATAIAEQTQPAVVPAEAKVVLESVVQFDFDRSELKPAALAALDRLLEKIAQHNIRRIEIGGHTCSIGTEVYNQGLSERRAAAVQRYLLDRGVDDSMIVTRGYGETRPAYSNDTEETRRFNRRAETRVFTSADE